MALKPARLQWSDDGILKSLDYGDIYFQRGKGLEESRHNFLDSNRLPARFKDLQCGVFRIAELGFGSGLNFLLAAGLFDKTAPPRARLVYASIEKHPIEKPDLARIYSHFAELEPFAAELQKQYPPLIEGFHTLTFLNGRITLLLLFGDVAEVLPQLAGKFDAWFLDGFSPAKNPAMWEEKLYPLIAARTAVNGTFATFSAAATVRNGLALEGFAAEKAKGFGVKRVMTVGTFRSGPAPAPVKKNITVLGAGIAGCAAAYALARRGHDVTLVDRQQNCAAETSGNPVAILYPKLTLEASPLALFHSHAFSLTRALVRALGLPSWRECGVTHLDIDEEMSLRSRDIIARNDFPEDYARLTKGGLRQPVGGFLSPAEFCRYLSRDIKTIYSRTAASLKKTGAAWQVLDSAGKAIAESDIVIMALGHGSKDFAQTAWLPLQYLRGQITLLKPTKELQALDTVICPDGFLAPVVDGLHSTGATFQREEPQPPQNRAEDDAENFARLQQYLPHFNFTKDHIAGSRSGYRVTTPDKLPLIGPCPDYENFLEDFAGLRAGKTPTAGNSAYFDGLYISTAFGAHGMTGAQLAAEMIAAQISGDPLPLPEYLLAYLQPERFIKRDLKRGKV